MNFQKEKAMENEMQVMDPTGHTTVKWDPRDPASIEVARATFKEMTAKGYSAFHVSNQPSQRMTEFDPSAKKMILVPHMQGG